MTELARTLDFTAEQTRLIKATLAIEATPAEFAYLMEVAKARHLNPLTKQIYFVKLSGKWTFQVSIDGLRAIAQRSGLYAGQDAPVFQYDNKGSLISCAISVYRKDWTRPAVGIAFMKEFTTGQNLWGSKPHVMLSKVAEAIALRKAFSEEMSGLYAEGELDQSTVVAPAPTLKAVTPWQPEKVESVTGEVVQDYEPSDLDVFESDVSDAAEPETPVLRVAFGKNAGKAVADLTERQVQAYVEMAEKNLATPGYKYAAKETVWLEALKADLDRRKK